MIDYIEIVDKLILLNSNEIDYYLLFSDGVKIGLILVFTVGFLGIGLNYCLKLFTKI